MYKIKLGGIYGIFHKETGQYYIGSSVDIFSRWQNHYTLLITGKHHSPELQELFNQSTINDFEFIVLKYISRTELRNKGLKGKLLEDSYRKLLLLEERNVMKVWSINLCLNKNKKYFS